MSNGFLLKQKNPRTRGLLRLSPDIIGLHRLSVKPYKLEQFGLHHYLMTLGYNKYMQNPLKMYETQQEKLKKQKIVLGGIFGVALVLGLALFIVVNQQNGNFVNPFSNAIDQTFGSKPDPITLIPNPLNGVLYPEATAAGWKDRRPLGVMINNHFDARPQAGLNDANIIYEVVAEGGITRYLAFFLDKLPAKVGPIRSTREYYLTLAKENGDAMLMHIGWSPQALEAIETWPVRSLGRGGVDCSFEYEGEGDICWRDFSRDVAFEHTAFADARELYKRGIDLGWQGTTEIKPWKFKDDKWEMPTSTECLVGECKMITIDFWYPGDYSGIFKFDKTDNTYLRFTGYDDKDDPAPLYDRETKDQVKVKNLIVQFAQEFAIAGDEKNRLDYELVGSGDAIVFIDGKAIKSTWSKAERDERTFFYDTDGNEIAFNRGNFWIAIVRDTGVDGVTY